MKITGKTRVLGIIGWPVAHSLSPVMHNAAVEYLGLDLCYIPFSVKEGSFDSAIKGIPALSIAGLNVTVPYKERVLSHLSEISKEAKIIGAVNTIKVEEDRLIGYNTDGVGFISSLKEVGHPVKNHSLLIIGAGGAAKAVVFQSAAEGAREIIIANRTIDKAIDLKRQTETHFPLIKINAIGIGGRELKNAISRADIVVNTTSLGLRMEDPSPLPNGLLHEGLFICDLIYNPPETALIRDARESGCQYMNGIGMLLHQGGASFKIWMEVEPPLEVMRQALETTIRSLHGYKQAR